MGELAGVTGFEGFSNQELIAELGRRFPPGSSIPPDLGRFAMRVNDRTNLHSSGDYFAFRNETSEALQIEVGLAHNQITDMVSGYIRKKLLPEKYRLPGISEFAREAVALSPLYSVTKEWFWKPEIVFYTDDLSLEQENSLLSGYRVSATKTTNGVYREWRGQESSVVDKVTKKPNDDKLWRLGLVCATDKPIIKGISADGLRGQNVEADLDLLAGLPGADESSDPETIVSRFSPTEKLYFWWQHLRLERGDKPLDGYSWTIGRENITTEKDPHSLFYYWNHRNLKVDSVARSVLRASESDGIRVSALAADFMC